MGEKQQYKTLKIEQKNPNSAVYHLYIHRPSHRNALSHDFFSEFPAALSSLDRNPAVNVIVLSGSGDHFSAGIDLSFFSSLQQTTQSSDRGRTGEKLRRQIKWLQSAITAIEECRKPVIAAICGACIGGAVDIVTACDIRYATEDAFFAVKEVDLGITADLGTLQRLPAIIGFGNAMELALTARRFSGSEAKVLGLVSGVFGSRVELDEFVDRVAGEIAAKSPLAVAGTKAVLLKSKDLNLEQGLDYIATWNSGMLLSDDLKEATSALFQKRKPTFAKL